MSNNTITINGGKFSSDKNKLFHIYAGDTGLGTGTGNVLNINTCVDGIVEEIYNPQTINFKAPSGMDTELPMLKVRNAVALAGVNFDVDVSNIPLAADDYITLIRNVNYTSFTAADDHYRVIVFTENGGYNELVYFGGTGSAFPKPDFEISTNGAKSGFDNYYKDPGGTVYNINAVNGTYDHPIQGNINFSDATATTSYSGNKIILRRGVYKNNIYASKADGTDKFEVKDNTLTIYNGTFNTASGDKTIITGGYGEQDENKGNQQSDSICSIETVVQGFCIDGCVHIYADYRHEVAQDMTEYGIDVLLFLIER